MDFLSMMIRIQFFNCAWKSTLLGVYISKRNTIQFTYRKICKNLHGIKASFVKSLSDWLGKSRIYGNLFLIGFNLACLIFKILFIQLLKLLAFIESWSILIK